MCCSLPHGLHLFLFKPRKFVCLFFVCCVCCSSAVPMLFVCCSFAVRLLVVCCSSAVHLLLVCCSSAVRLVFVRFVARLLLVCSWSAVRQLCVFLVCSAFALRLLFVCLVCRENGIFKICDGDDLLKRDETHPGPARDPQGGYILGVAVLALSRFIYLYREMVFL